MNTFKQEDHPCIFMRTWDKYRLLHGWWTRTIFNHELLRTSNERVRAANEWVCDSSQRVDKNRTSELTMKQFVDYARTEILPRYYWDIRFVEKITVKWPQVTNESWTLFVSKSTATSMKKAAKNLCLIRQICLNYPKVKAPFFKAPH